MWIIDWYWNIFLERLILWGEDFLGYELIRPWAPNVVKWVLTLFIVLSIYEVYLRIGKYIRSRRFIAESMPVVPPSSETVDKGSDFIQQLESLKAPQQTIERLKKEKRYRQLGEVFVSMQKYKEAGWAFYKAGDLKRSATEYAKAGKTYLSAKLLLKAGEPLQSATLLASIGKYKTAAKWLEKSGYEVEASFYWWDAGYKDKAIRTWMETLQSSRVSVEIKSVICNKVIQIIFNSGISALPDKSRKELVGVLLDQLMFEKRFDLAIDLALRSGDLQTAEKIKRALRKSVFNQ